MKRNLFFLVSIASISLFSDFCFGQYAYSTIPDSLVLGADAVLREYNLKLDIRSERIASLNVLKAITVLRKKGDGFGQFNLNYDKFSRPERIEISLYNAFGKLVKKVKSSEIKDYSAYEEGTLFSDNRIKVYNPSNCEYPYTIVYEYSVTLNGYISLPVFQPMSNFGISVQQASCSIVTGEGVSCRYHEINFNNRYTSAFHSGSQFEWTVSGLPALTYEPLSIGLEEVTPTVILSPYKFEYDGSRGDCSTWVAFGNWVNDLLKDRGALPEKTRSLVHDLTDTILGNYKKARRLYEHVQTKTRYVSIQLGIGGYQPFSAEIVDKLSYGDCKALSNYYIALLKEAGIPAIYAITTMEVGNPFFLNEFPATIYFNHVVVCVPFENDSVWVECTSSHLPFGIMGEDVLGHPALLVIPGEGKIVFVPEKPKYDLMRSRNIDAKLLPDGRALLKMQVSYSGLKLSDGLGQFVLRKKEQSDYLYNDLYLNDFVIDRFNYIYKKEAPAMVRLDAEITCKKYGSITGNRMFLPFNQGGSIVLVPDRAENRKLPFELSTTYNNVDSLTIQIPEGYSLESLPKSFRSESKFGYFILSVLQADTKINIVQYLHLSEGVYPAVEYDEFRDFLLATQKAEKQKIFLKMN